MLVTFIVLYLLVSIAIGLYAATRVKNTTDYAVAGRSLPLSMVIATTFATWFGSETVLGMSATFIDGGLDGVVEDPFGAGICLILVGLFFADRLYRMTLITLSDYYRERFGRTIEVACSLIIMLQLPGLGVGAGHGAGPGVQPAVPGDHLGHAGHGAGYRHRAGLHAVRRHVVGGGDRFRPDDHDRAGPARHRRGSPPIWPAAPTR